MDIFFKKIRLKSDSKMMLEVFENRCKTLSNCGMVWFGDGESMFWFVKNCSTITCFSSSIIVARHLWRDLTADNKIFCTKLEIVAWSGKIVIRYFRDLNTI